MILKLAPFLAVAYANAGSSNEIAGSIKASGLEIAWGFGLSSFQTEGSWNVDDKGESIWDHWWHEPQRMQQSGNISGDVAIDHYKRYKEDLKFSISWARILPNCSGTVNDLAIKYYSDYIDRIIAEGASPLLTLYHWDLPQACEDQYGSWTNRKIVDDFTNYADVIFTNFGDRVKNIITINEPETNCNNGYETTGWPPGQNKGRKGMFACMHYTNLAHGSAVQLGRTKHKDKNLKFGMTVIVPWLEPLNPDSAADKNASNFYMHSRSDWNWSPLISGDYSDILRRVPGFAENLPVFTPEEKTMLKGSMDFLALNYYSSNYIYADGDEYTITNLKNNVSIGPKAESTWLTVFPKGIRSITNWAYKEFQLPIYLTECGVSVPNEQKLNIDDVVNDVFRQSYFTEHYNNLKDAIEIDKVPIKLFIAWALFDNFEWRNYDERFGVIAVDINNRTLARTMKNSANVVMNLFKDSVSPFTLPGKGSGKNGEPKLSSMGLLSFTLLILVNYLI